MNANATPAIVNWILKYNTTGKQLNRTNDITNEIKRYKEDRALQ
jgi:hypothetical protein